MLYFTHFGLWFIVTAQGVFATSKLQKSAMPNIPFTPLFLFSFPSTSFCLSILPQITSCPLLPLQNLLSQIPLPSKLPFQLSTVSL